MFNNTLVETLYVENVYGEYLRYVNQYHNVERKSVFCRYLNINEAASGFNNDANATFDRYNSGVQYDIYDYTPSFYTSQIINDAGDVPDLKGQMFSGSLTVTLYTIQKPRIEDIIIFNRAPQQGEEIFRVDHVRAALNAMNSNPGAYWFELVLEYAPLVNVSQLNFLNHYVYTMPMQKYIDHKDFVRVVKETDHMLMLLKEFEKLTFNNKLELYTYEYGGQTFAPLLENNIIYTFLATKNEYQDHFDTIKRPYGVKQIGNTGYYNLKTKEIFPVLVTPQINFVNTIEDQSLPVSIFEIVHLIRLWIWERQRDKFPAYKVPEESIYPDISGPRIGLTSKNTLCRPGIGLSVDVSSLPLKTVKG